MVFVLDNYDSFTYNLVQYMGELGAEIVVRRNDELTPDEVEALQSTPEVVKRLEEQGATPVKMTSAEFGKYMQDEASRWQMVIDKAGIKGE